MKRDSYRKKVLVVHRQLSRDILGNNTSTGFVKSKTNNRVLGKTIFNSPYIGTALLEHD